MDTISKIFSPKKKNSKEKPLAFLKKQKKIPFFDLCCFKDSKRTLENYLKNNASKIKYTQFVQWGKELTTIMQTLAHFEICHGQICSKNVIVANGLSLKLSNFENAFFLTKQQDNLSSPLRTSTRSRSCTDSGYAPPVILFSNILRNNLLRISKGYESDLEDTGRVVSQQDLSSSLEESLLQNSSKNYSSTFKVNFASIPLNFELSCLTPEQTQTENALFSLSSDLFCLGNVFWEILNCIINCSFKKAFSVSSSLHPLTEMKKLFDNHYRPPIFKELPMSISNLLENLWENEPEKRGPTELLDQFFQEFKITEEIEEPLRGRTKLLSMFNSIKHPSELVCSNNILGFGNNSIVIQSQFKNSLKAVKVSFVQCQEKEKLLEEVEMLKKIRHSNILQLDDYLQTQNAVYLIFPIAKGNLKSLIGENHFLQENIIRLLISHIIPALAYLKNENVVHRDIKLENILYDFDEKGLFHFFLSDFGFATHSTCEKSETSYGTIIYTSPETIQNGSITSSVDVWSFGITLYRLSCGKFPFENCDVWTLLEKIKNDQPDTSDLPISQKLKDFISFCLQFDVKNRFDPIKHSIDF